MSLTPKNWDEFQHYKDRRPPWIKLHKGLLDDFVFARLPVASRALAPLLWLLASEYDGGKISATTEEIAFRLRITENELIEAINPLIESGFLLSDSEPLAPCKQSARLEEKRRGETEKRIPRASRDDPEFLEWYETYPRHEARGDALKAFREARKKVDSETLLTATKQAKQKYAGSDPKFIPLPATWLRAERWLDKPNGRPGASRIEGII